MLKAVMWSAVMMSAACLAPPQAPDDLGSERAAELTAPVLEGAELAKQVGRDVCPEGANPAYASCQTILCPNPISGLGDACRAKTPAGDCPAGQVYLGFGAYLFGEDRTCYCGCTLN